MDGNIFLQIWNSHQVSKTNQMMRKVSLYTKSPLRTSE